MEIQVAPFDQAYFLKAIKNSYGATANIAPNTMEKISFTIRTQAQLDLIMGTAASHYYWFGDLVVQVNGADIGSFNLVIDGDSNDWIANPNQFGWPVLTLKNFLFQNLEVLGLIGDNLWSISFTGVRAVAIS